MAQRFFNITLPANANYYNLWDRLQLATGFTTGYSSSEVCEAIICSDSAIIRVADNNYANAPGVPVQINGNLTMRASRNAIELKNIYVSGSGANISGVLTWM